MVRFSNVAFFSKTRVSGWSSTLLAGLFLSQGTFAGDRELLELMRVLRDNGTITEAQFRRLSQAMQSDSQVPEAVPETETLDVLVDVDGGGIEATSADGQFSFELGGRVMTDATWYDEDQVTLGDGTELRRARIEVEGVMFGDWGYELGVDFADGAEVKDGYVSYLGWPNKTVKVGQFKEPFSLEELTSSKYTTFMERALPNAFAPGRNIGIGFAGHADGWTAAAGLFGEAFDDDPDDEGDEGWGGSGRVTYAAGDADNRLLHLGAAAAYRETDEEDELRIRARPESHLTDVRFVNTGKIADVANSYSLGAEVAAVLGPWSLQGEYITTHIDRATGLPDYDVDGWYLFGSWFLTGESRHYKRKSGRFGKIRPRAAEGAWEIALRYSTLDLNDADLTGGEAKHWTLGANWYLNKNLRLMANYLRIDNDRHADDDGDVSGGDSPDIFQLRLQAHF